MEALAKLLADITEFLVGGVLLLGSAAILIHVLFPEDFQRLTDRQVSDSLGGAVTIVAVALMYAFGVMAESASRMLFEWRLTLLTVRSDFGGDRTEADRPDDEVQAPEPAPHPTNRRRRGAGIRHRHAHRTPRAARASAASEDGTSSAWTLRPLRDLPARLAARFGLPSPEECKAAKDCRERWRADATTYRESLGNTIEAQLKRLRIERTFFLCCLICLVAALTAQSWSLVIVTAVLSVVSALLVDERFRRFLGAIVRAHEIMRAEAGTQADGGVEVSA